MRLFPRPGKFPGLKAATRVCAAGILAVCLVLTVGVTTSRADSLQQLLQEVGPEYGEAYASPFIHTFGPNQNSNLFSTASIPYSGLTFGIGIKVMATQLNEDDKTFRKVVKVSNLGDYDPSLEGRTGTFVMSGPTIFGDENETGKVDVYADGVYVDTIEGISGFWDTSWVPLATPEVQVGGIAGLMVTLRYLPSIQMGDFGKTTYLGYGLQWSASGVLENLPIDLMIGFFRTSLDVDNDQDLGPSKLVDSEANSYFLAASKSWPAMTLYGGFAMEDSKMEVAYLLDNDPDQKVNFSVDGRQETRFTVGLTLDILLDLNVEAGFGDMTTYSAGLMFGF